MIHTKYNITIQIDDIDYNITVTEPTKEQAKEIKRIANKSKDTFLNRNQIIFDIEEYNKMLSINDKLIENLSDEEKRIELLLENKNIAKQIAELKAEIKKIDSTIFDIEENIEEAYKYRFKITVSGENKVSLENVIENSNITYRGIFDVIGSAVSAEKEKKTQS